MTTPTTAEGNLDALWELLAQDIHAHGYSVRDALKAHRATIEAAARAEAVKEWLAEALRVESAWLALKVGAWPKPSDYAIDREGFEHLQAEIEDGLRPLIEAALLATPEAKP